MRKIALLAVSALLLAGLATGATAKRSAVHEVIMSGGPALLFTYQPDDLTIAKGDRIAWSNASTGPHNVTFYDAPVDDSFHVVSGDAFVKRFKKKGTYLYRCDVTGHSLLVGGECVGMCGRFTVE